MKPIIVFALTLGLATPALAAPAAPPVSDPTALVRKLYANVVSDQGPGDPLWWSYLTGRAATSFAQVLRAERKSGDELVDEDFLCQCQDPSGLRLTSLTITDRTASQATAHVRFAFSDSPSRVVKMTIALASDGRGWKIAEMTNGDGQSFTARTSTR